MRSFYLVAFLLICFSTKAQIDFGAKAGISVPNLKGNSEQSKGYTSRQGFYGGFVANFKLNSSLTLQPELDFSPQGGQRNEMQPVPADAMSGISLPPGVNLYADFNTTAILNYLEIPVLLKFTFGNKLKYYLCGGPYISFLLEAKTKTSGSSLLYLDAAGTIPLTIDGNPLPPVSFDATTDINESIKTVNAGVEGGLGLQYPVGKGNIFLEGRAIFGITNIQTYPEIDGKNTTGSLALAAGYLFKLK